MSDLHLVQADRKSLIRLGLEPSGIYSSFRKTKLDPPRREISLLHGLDEEVSDRLGRQVVDHERVTHMRERKCDFALGCAISRARLIEQRSRCAAWRTFGVTGGACDEDSQIILELFRLSR